MRNASSWRRVSGPDRPNSSLERDRASSSRAARWRRRAARRERAERSGSHDPSLPPDSDSSQGRDRYPPGDGPTGHRRAGGSTRRPGRAARWYRQGPPCRGAVVMQWGPCTEPSFMHQGTSATKSVPIPPHRTHRRDRAHRRRLRLRSDLWRYRGIPPVAEAGPIGHECCGVVEAVGDAATTGQGGRLRGGRVQPRRQHLPGLPQGATANCQHGAHYAGARPRRSASRWRTERCSPPRIPTRT